MKLLKTFNILKLKSFKPRISNKELFNRITQQGISSRKESTLNIY